MTVNEVRLDRVTVAIRGKQLVREVTLAVGPGEVLALVGPNGAGKSTLLRVLAGDIAPTGGRALLDGKPMDRYPPRELARKRAVLPQQTVVQFAFTAREIVEMGRGERAIEDDGVVTRSLARTDTLHLAHRIFPSLSGGEQARVTLSRVLAQEAPILLLDEPTSALDLHHQQMVMQVMRELTAEGARVVAILHDLNLAAAFADRVGLMREGRLVALGTPWETYRADLLSEVFACEIAVVAHPARDCPLIIPMAAAFATEPRSDLPSALTLRARQVV